MHIAAQERREDLCISDGGIGSTSWPPVLCDRQIRCEVKCEDNSSFSFDAARPASVYDGIRVCTAIIQASRHA